ncbi:hypothetical protein [Nocardioides sp.]|uniref:hypothetical protein n=1 Tax=Nocardioides sp. TaxID=35761 RepID=UPI00378332BF
MKATWHALFPAVLGGSCAIWLLVVDSISTTWSAPWWVLLGGGLLVITVVSSLVNMRVARQEAADTDRQR